MSSRLNRLCLMALMAASVWACRNAPPDDRDYATRVQAERTEKDESFQKGTDPIPESRKKEFLPLAYFPIDPDYNVPAALKSAVCASTRSETSGKPSP